MTYTHVKITVEEIREALPTFSRRQILELDQKIHDYYYSECFLTALSAANRFFLCDRYAIWFRLV